MENREETGTEQGYKVGPNCPPLETRFKPGVCPNPKGRPKGVSIKKEMENLLAITLRGEFNPLTDAPEDMPVNRKIALNLLVKACEGDLNAILKTLEHVDGKPSETVKMQGDSENPLKIDQKMIVEIVRCGVKDAESG